MFFRFERRVRGTRISSSRMDAETISTMSRLLASYCAIDLVGSISTPSLPVTFRRMCLMTTCRICSRSMLIPLCLNLIALDDVFRFRMAEAGLMHDMLARHGLLQTLPPRHREGLFQELQDVPRFSGNTASDVSRKGQDLGCRNNVGEQASSLQFATLVKSGAHQHLGCE